MKKKNNELNLHFSPEGLKTLIIDPLIENMNIGYISLKLQRQLDVVKLRDMINDLISGDEAIGISMKWLDLVEILLKADGSWDKKPFLYHKYNIRKNKNEVK